MTSRTLPLTMLSAFALATGCSFDLVEVDSAREATLALTLERPQCDAPPVLSASFHPGSGSDGSLRAASDDTLRIGAADIPPDDVLSNGWRVYPRHVFDSDSGFSSRIDVRAPRLDGGSEISPSFAFEMLRTAAPDTITVNREGNVEVAVQGMSGDGGGVHGEVLDEVTRQVSWQLEVRDHEAAGRFLLLAGAEVPPGVLRFPAGLLPNAFESGRLAIRVYIVQGFSSLAGDYTVRLDRTFDCSVVLDVTDSLSE